MSGASRSTAGIDTPGQAPFRLMTLFLRAVTEERMQDALDIASLILEYEPTNQIVLEYKDVLMKYDSRIRGPAESTADGAVSESEDDSVTSQSVCSEDDTDSCYGRTADFVNDSRMKQREYREPAKRTTVGGNKSPNQFTKQLMNLRMHAESKHRKDQASWDESTFFLGANKEAKKNSISNRKL